MGKALRRPWKCARCKSVTRWGAVTQLWPLAHACPEQAARPPTQACSVPIPISSQFWQFFPLKSLRRNFVDCVSQICVLYGRLSLLTHDSVFMEMSQLARTRTRNMQRHLHGPFNLYPYLVNFVFDFNFGWTFVKLEAWCRFRPGNTNPNRNIVKNSETTYNGGLCSFQLSRLDRTSSGFSQINTNRIWTGPGDEHLSSVSHQRKVKNVAST